MFYILELYCGNGEVSSMAGKMLECEHIETVDIDPQWEPSVLVDIMDWDNNIHGTALKQKYGDRRPIVWASPPCQDYSKMNTTGSRNLKLADERVKKIKEICDFLDAHIVIIENPETGLLKSRPFMQEWVSSDYIKGDFTVDYCQFGWNIKKRTKIWSTVDLREYGFTQKICPGNLDCLSMYRCQSTCRYRHMTAYEDLDWSERIRIPYQLINTLFRSVMLYMTPVLDLLTNVNEHYESEDEELPAKRMKTTKEVVSIKRVLEDGMVMVTYRGHDNSDVIQLRQLGDSWKKLYMSTYNKIKIKKLLDAAALNKN